LPRATPGSPQPSSEELALLLAELSRRQELERLTGSLREFIRAAWPIVEPGTSYVSNWHLDAIADHLQAVTEGKIHKLLINVPPRHMKSLATSVFWPVWTWLLKPAHRFLFSSYSESLSMRDSLKCRDILRSGWFQSRWPSIKIKPDQDTKTRFDLIPGGYRLATSVGGSTTGEGGDTLVVDDPHSLDDTFSDANREAALRWWGNTMSSRMNDRATSSRVIICQRIHEADLSGYILSRETGWVHLVMPAEYVPSKTFSSPIGWKDPRTTEAELLWPQRFSAKDQQDIKRESGSYSYAGQQQQDPQPAEGGMFAAKYFRYFDAQAHDYALHLPDGRMKHWPKRLVLMFQCFDTAIKEKETTTSDPDYTVCLTAGVTPDHELLVLDVVRERIPVPEQYEFTVKMRKRFPTIAYQFVEDKSSGQGLIQAAKRSRFPFLDLNERLKSKGITNFFGTSKQERALTVSILYEAGNVYHLAGAPWLVHFESELLHFPVGAHDDMVDSVAYAGVCVKYGPRLAVYSDVAVPDPRRQPPTACGCPHTEGLGFGHPGMHHPQCPRHPDNKPTTADWRADLTLINPAANQDWRSGFAPPDWRSDL
jgi:predicted phage terminase large subunit-like protein